MPPTVLRKIDLPLSTEQNKLFLLPHNVLFKYHEPVVNVENKGQPQDLKSASAQVHMTSSI